MHRFKIEAVTDNMFLVTKEELHHLTHVLRLGPGDKVTGFDNSGGQWVGMIESLTKDSAVCRVIEKHNPGVEANTKIYLVMGLSKGEKMEWVVQKGTELGMAGFIPLRARRSVVQLEGKKARERVVRWQRIASEAVKQSHRVVEPLILNILDWKDLKHSLPEDTRWIIPYEEETSSLNEVLAGFAPEHPIAILIGPEGGFTADEVEQARTALEALSVSLGPRILRTETAALAALTIVLARFGDLG